MRKIIIIALVISAIFIPRSTIAETNDEFFMLSLNRDQVAQIEDKNRDLKLDILTPSEARYSLAKKILLIGTGFAAGKLIVHNGGHHLAAKLTGTEIAWSSPNSGDWRPRWKIHQTGKWKKRLVVGGGFLSQFTVTEILLGWDKIPKNHPLVIGILLWGIADEIIYPILHETRNGGYCDIKYLAETGINPRYIEAALISHAAITIYRLYTGKEFPLFIKTTAREIVVGLSWKF